MVCSDAVRGFREFFDGEYAEFWRGQARRYGHDDGHQRLIDLALSATPPGGLLLDCGMGNGFPFTLAWSRARRVAGCDLSEKALHLARPWLEGGAGARLAVADLAALPFKDGCAATVVSARALNYVPRFFDALAELWRVTAPGGHLIFDVFTRPPPRPWRHRLAVLLGMELPGMQHAADVGRVRAWFSGQEARIRLHDDHGRPLAEAGLERTLWIVAARPS